MLSFLQEYVTESQISVNNIKCAILFWTEYLLFTFLFYVFFVLMTILLWNTQNEFLHSIDFKKQHKKACSMELNFSKNLTQFLSIFGSCITYLCKSCDSCYRKRKNINYEILLLHSSLKIMCVRACVSVCVCTHTCTNTNYARKPTERKFSLYVVLLIIEIQFHNFLPSHCNEFPVSVVFQLLTFT